MSQTFGIVFQHVGLTEYIATALDAVTQEEVEADMDRVTGTFPFKALDTGFGCEKHEIAASSRHYLAMKKLVKDNNFDALAIRCWPEVREISYFGFAKKSGWRLIKETFSSSSCPALLA